MKCAQAQYYPYPYLCLPSGNNGTCLALCGGAFHCLPPLCTRATAPTLLMTMCAVSSECGGDCPVCSGDDRCHGEVTAAVAIIAVVPPL